MHSVKEKQNWNMVHAYRKKNKTGIQHSLKQLKCNISGKTMLRSFITFMNCCFHLYYPLPLSAADTQSHLYILISSCSTLISDLEENILVTMQPFV